VVGTRNSTREPSLLLALVKKVRYSDRPNRKQVRILPDPFAIDRESV